MSQQFAAVDVIRTKRDRGELSDAQIDWVVDAYTRGDVAEEQMSSLAMAVLLNGMTRREVSRWTSAMIASGAASTSPTCRDPASTSTPPAGWGTR